MKYQALSPDRYHCWCNALGRTEFLSISFAFARGIILTSKSLGVLHHDDEIFIVQSSAGKNIPEYAIVKSDNGLNRYSIAAKRLLNVECG